MRIDTPHLVIPAWLAHKVSSEAVKLDYDYQGGEKLWRLAKNQDITTEIMSKDQLLAMRIAEHLEK